MKVEARQLVTSVESLTHFETRALYSRVSLADGHAYHEMPDPIAGVIKDLSTIWREAESRPIPEQEERYKARLAELIGSPALLRHESYSVSPTASSSIDIAATWLRQRGYTVGLIEPVFDNLHLIVKRREVGRVAIRESELIDLDALGKRIDRERIDALFIVNPNNPTGFQLSERQFRALVTFLAKRGVALIIDRTFRFYSELVFDDYEILVDSGIDFIVLEDSGKTWPTLDLKVSLLAYSQSITGEMRRLYEEIFLCHSPFALGLHEALLRETRKHSLKKLVWDLVSVRAGQIRAALDGCPLEIQNGDCKLPVLWVSCERARMTDFEVHQRFERSGLSVLPGRFFYWCDDRNHRHFIRISLMRPEAKFQAGARMLAELTRQL
ncbi:aminotransferase class I/II-fold pyridoxal phosphate-dependent enzyme [Sorangium sp. So ce269]